MSEQAVVMSPTANRFNDFGWLDSTSRTIVRVFQTNEPRANHVVVFGSNQVAKLVYGHDAMGTGDGLTHYAGELGEGGLFVIVDMAIGIADEFSAPVTMHTNRNLVRHRTAGHEESGLFSQNFCGQPFELVGRGIDIDDGVTHIGIRDRTSHLRRWTGNGVAAKVDHGFHQDIGN